jgi:hypothetical protein
MGSGVWLQCTNPKLLNVRFGSKADIREDATDVRFTPKSGHRSRSYSFAMSGSCRQRAAGAGGHAMADCEQRISLTLSQLPL